MAHYKTKVYTHWRISVIVQLQTSSRQSKIEEGRYIAEIPVEETIFQLCHKEVESK